MFWTRFLGFLAIALAFALPARAQSITDLGTLGGVSSFASGINDAGQIVGDSYTSGGRDHAFLWQGGAMNDLGTLGGPNSNASAINSGGQIVGTSDLDTSRPFLWQNGAMTQIPSLGSGPTGANGINNSGQVVGASFNDVYRPYVWQAGGAATGLGSIPGGFGGGANAINNAGQIVGYSFIGSDYHAFESQNSGALKDLGTLPGGARSIAEAINDSGQVVGKSTVGGGNYHAFESQSGVMKDLGTLPGGNYSEASGINSIGTTIGVASTAGGANHAAVWQNGAVTPVDLNSLLPANSGWTLQQATAINNHGQVVGVGVNQGQSHAFEMTLPTAGTILGQSVAWSATANGMHGVFVPNGGLTLANAAQYLGYNHFNWVQVVEQTSARDLALDGFRNMNGASPTPPFYDPVPGGYRYQGASPGHPAADSLPFYWDEVFSSPGIHRTPDAVAPGANQLTLFTNDFDHANALLESQLTLPAHSLGFVDYPGTPSGDRIEFLTMLVGVHSDGSWDALNLPGTVIRWQEEHGVGTALQNLIPIGSSDTTVTEFVVPGGLTANELAMIESAGGQVVVPEPSALLLILSGTILILSSVTIRRRLRRESVPARVGKRLNALHSWSVLNSITSRTIG